MLKVKPILYMFGKGGISVLQTAIFKIYILVKISECVFAHVQALTGEFAYSHRLKLGTLIHK